MIHLELEQGTPEWHLARLGIPTASQFSRILTPAKLTPSAASANYMCELLAAWRTGVIDRGEDNPWMARGRDMEDEAARWYAFDRDAELIAAGFCATDDGRAGVSPDRLVGDAGLLEIKCPSLAVHLQAVTGALDLAAKHRSQVQGQLWVTGREWCDVLSYCPGAPAHVVRVLPDPEWVAAWVPALTAFSTALEAHAAELIAAGTVMLGCPMPERVVAHGDDAEAIVADLRAECARTEEPTDPEERAEPEWSPAP